MLAINPVGKVPFLTINGKCFSESAACLRLVAQILPTLVENGYYPTDEYERHAVNATLDFNLTTYLPLMLERNLAFFA